MILNSSSVSIYVSLSHSVTHKVSHDLHENSEISTSSKVVFGTSEDKATRSWALDAFGAVFNFDF